MYSWVRFFLLMITAVLGGSAVTWRAALMACSTGPREMMLQCRETVAQVVKDFALLLKCPKPSLEFSRWTAPSHLTPSGALAFQFRFKIVRSINGR